MGSETQPEWVQVSRATTDRAESACPFRPPAPAPGAESGSFLLRFWKGRKNLLQILPASAYQVFMGRTHLGLRDLFFISSPNRVRQFLKADADNFPKSRQMYRALQPLVGDGIFISNGEVWRRRRQMVNPAFENVRLRVAFPLMRAAVDDMIGRFSALPDGYRVDIGKEMAHVTADIVFRAIFSQPLTQQISRDVFEAFGRYQAALPQLDLVEILGLPDWIPRRSLRKAKRAGREIREILGDIIERRHRDTTDECRGDILDTLLRSRDAQGRPFSVEELIDEVAVLFLAGHETSATALSWAIYLTSQCASVEQRLVAEACQIIGRDSLEFDDINRLRLARNVFKEALRLYPPVSFITREALEERRIGRWDLRPNSMVVVSPWAIHRHRRFWQAPDCFDPDRYDREETRISEKQAYLPFGVGQRVCPGASFAMLEGPLILGSLFRSFRVDIAPDPPIDPVCRLTTRPSGSLEARLYRRGAGQQRLVGDPSCNEPSNVGEETE